MTNKHRPTKYWKMITCHMPQYILSKVFHMLYHSKRKNSASFSLRVRLRRNGIMPSSRTSCELLRNQDGLRPSCYAIESLRERLRRPSVVHINESLRERLRRPSVVHINESLRERLRHPSIVPINESPHEQLCRPSIVPINESLRERLHRPSIVPINESLHEQLCRPSIVPINESLHEQLCRPSIVPINDSLHEQLCRSLTSRFTNSCAVLRLYPLRVSLMGTIVSLRDLHPLRVSLMGANRVVSRTTTQFFGCTH
jgi:hypothetical protein